MEKKIVLITGASSGIGEGCARKFAMNGYRLILNGRNVEKLNAVKKELLEKYGADVYLLLFDVRDRQAAHAALESDRKSTRLNSSHLEVSRMPSSA